MTHTFDDAAMGTMFTYLDGLRESGVTNMFGAGSYIEQEFLLNNRDARAVLVAWMEGFNEKSNT